MSVPVTLPVREIVPQRVNRTENFSLTSICSLAGLPACEERLSLYLIPRRTICEVS